MGFFPLSRSASLATLCLLLTGFPLAAQPAPVAPPTSLEATDASSLVFLAVWMPDGTRVAGIVEPGQAFTLSLDDGAESFAFHPSLNEAGEVETVAIFEGKEKAGEAATAMVRPLPGELIDVTAAGRTLQLEALAFEKAQLEAVHRCCVPQPEGGPVACGLCIE